MTYKNFFETLTGKQPYPYQQDLASAWPDLLNAPTGLGKTAAVAVAWLWRRCNNEPGTPRRLVYCLPMRVLVEQTAREIRKWIAMAGNAGFFPEDQTPAVYTLMGGDIANDWDMDPDRSTVLVGTQDQLLSRALNRGYAMSRFRWPMHFGLLHNDCLWVLDEVQLMGAGLATTAQLEAFRQNMGTITPCRSLWMSATLDKTSLNTVDFLNSASRLRECTLTAADMAEAAVRQRLEARKPVITWTGDWYDTGAIAEMILSNHRKGTRTLAVFNTVNRASDVYKCLQRRLEHKSAAALTLVHSRFRPPDRIDAMNRLLAEPAGPGGIAVATQVVEAGVDVSATTLITDIAPWSSLVQRFGRCNRHGSDREAKIICLDMGTEREKREKAVAPYDLSDIDAARDILKSLSDAAPGRLPPGPSVAAPVTVIRKRDIVDLSDTTPDLSGLDVDISRFIRDEDHLDVQVFWRAIAAGRDPGPEEFAPGRDELCPVPVSELRSSIKLDLWRWDHLDQVWTKQNNHTIIPGMVLMMRQADGGYHADLGWTGNRRDIADLNQQQERKPEGDSDDPETVSVWQTLPAHTDAVISELQTILDALKIPAAWRTPLFTASQWHDAGKAHAVFQNAAGDPLGEAFKDPVVVWGKTGKMGLFYERKGFRHELASALAMLENGMPDLAVYLASAHHGKVRLSIRSLPHEESPPGDPARRFARGIWDREVLHETLLCSSLTMPETSLDLSCMEMGDGSKGPSWSARMLSLRDDPELGIFRMALLEALVRIADWRASRKLTEE